MTALSLILIGLMTPINEYQVDVIPKAISFVVAEDRDITQSVLIKNRGDDPISLELTYKPFNIDVDQSRWIEAREAINLSVTLRVPEGTRSEIEEIYREIKDKANKRRRLPPMTMVSKLAYLVRVSKGGEVDTLEIPLRLSYEIEQREVLGENPY